MSDETKKILLTRDGMEEYRIEEFLKNPEVLRILEAIIHNDLLNKHGGKLKPIIISPSDDLYE